MFPWNLFPFNKDMHRKLQQMKPDEINQYVQHAMEQMGKLFQSSEMPNFFQPEEFLKPENRAEKEKCSTPVDSKGNAIQYSLYETHDFIYVRILIEEEQWLQQLKLYYTSNLLLIKNIPILGAKHTIPLPSLVKRKGSTARYKDEILEIKILKNIDLQFSEIQISER